MEYDKCFEMHLFFYRNKNIFAFLMKLDTRVVWNDKTSSIILCTLKYTMVPFLLHYWFFFEILLDKIGFMKIKILKPRHQNLNSKLDGIHFVKFI